MARRIGDGHDRLTRERLSGARRRGEEERRDAGGREKRVMEAHASFSRWREKVPAA
jgi:hypothetical protein